MTAGERARKRDATDRAAASPGGSGSAKAPWWHEAARGADGSGDTTEALVGAALDEFARLMDSVSAWPGHLGIGQTVRSMADQASTAIRSDHRVDDRICRSCPLCQALAALRAVRPETADNLLEAMASFNELVYAALDALAGSSPSGGEQARADGL